MASYNAQLAPGYMNTHITPATLNLDALRTEYDFQTSFVEKNDNKPHENLVEPFGWHRGDDDAIILMENWGVCEITTTIYRKSYFK